MDDVQVTEMQMSDEVLILIHENALREMMNMKRRIVQRINQLESDLAMLDADILRKQYQIDAARSRYLESIDDYA